MFVPVSVVLLTGINQAIVPSALALTRLMQQIGASVGSAYAATLLDRGYSTALSSIAGTITMSRGPIASAVLAHGSQAIANLSAIASAQAANLSAVNTTQFFAILTLAATVLPMLMVRRTPVRPPASAAPQPPARVEIGAIRVPERQPALR